MSRTPTIPGISAEIHPGGRHQDHPPEDAALGARKNCGSYLWNPIWRASTPDAVPETLHRKLSKRLLALPALRQLRGQRPFPFEEAAQQGYAQTEDGQDRAHQSRCHVTPTPGDDKATEECTEGVGNI
jgi:hypothetical protein